jgi:Fic family protein
MKHLIDEILNFKAELDAFHPLSKEVEARIMQKFRLDWNYHSNHIEGNSLNYGETKALILFGVTAQGKPLKDHLEITGHNEALNWIIDLVKQEKPLTENFIRELHTLLLKEPYEKKSISQDGKTVLTRRIEVGKYKTEPNHVLTQTGEIFRFATPEETPAKMHDLILWFREKSKKNEVNPIELATEFHYKFIRIHPFDDGNGRTARILMNFILMQFGYPPVIIKTEDKENYFAVLRLADAGNLEPFKEYIALNLLHSLELMIKGAKGEKIEEEDDLDKELTLLKNELKVNLSPSNKILKNKEVLIDLFENSVLNLIEKFIKSCEKFNDFYIKTDFYLVINDKICESIDDDFLENGKKLIDDDIDWISLDYRYEIFNYSNYEDKIHVSRIYFEFLNSKYIIKTYNSTDCNIEKLYSEKLNKIEIDNIIDIEIERHKKEIIKVIKEINK